jgi:hypothetical protein
VSRRGEKLSVTAKLLDEARAEGAPLNAADPIVVLSLADE